MLILAVCLAGAISVSFAFYLVVERYFVDLAGRLFPHDTALARQNAMAQAMG